MPTFGDCRLKALCMQMLLQEPLEVRVDYPGGNIADPGDCRAAAVAMHREAFAGLGWPDPRAAAAARSGGADWLSKYGVAAGVAIGVVGCFIIVLRARK